MKEDSVKNVSIKDITHLIEEKTVGDSRQQKQQFAVLQFCVRIKTGQCWTLGNKA